LLSGIRDKLTKISMYRTILKNQIGKFIAFVKRVLSREGVAVAEQYVENWKNYYGILRVNPNAEAEAITAAYKRLVHLYHHTLSDKTKKSPFFSEMMNDVNEAYQVLSEPIRRTAYDRIFFAKYNSPDVAIEESTREGISDLMRLVAQDVFEKKRRIQWRIPGWSKVTQRAILIAVISFLSIFLGGTSLAFAQPEHALAAPFKGVAITVTMTSSEAISLIEGIRRLVATYERNIVSTALQSMRVIEGVGEVPPVTVSTNDMARFPSPEHCLFPDYLDKRFSQFKYTVDSNGIVNVDPSGATTDVLLKKIKQWLDRLVEGK